MSTQIVPVKERAIQALGYPDLAATVAELKVLASESADITTITNQAAYGQCHRMEMRLKNVRVDITKKGKAARDDANAYNKAVIEIEKQLIAVTSPEEERLATLKAEWDAARERERQAEIDAENARLARIQAALDDIRALPQEAMGKTSAHALSVLAEAEALKITEAEYQEAFQTAQSALYLSITAIKGIVAERQAAEAEAAKVAAERAELAKLRAEQEALERAESIRVAQELAAARAETERLQAIAREAENEARRQTAELERQRREADEKRLAEDLRVQALQEAEAQRLVDERAELERRERELEAAKRKPIQAALPSIGEIVEALSGDFGMTYDDVVKMLAGIDWHRELASHG